MESVKYGQVEKITSKIKKNKKEEPVPEPTVKICPYCFSEISVKATRCPHCTSELVESVEKEEVSE